VLDEMTAFLAERGVKRLEDWRGGLLGNGESSSERRRKAGAGRGKE